MDVPELKSRTKSGGRADKSNGTSNTHRLAKRERESGGHYCDLMSCHVSVESQLGKILMQAAAAVKNPPLPKLRCPMLCLRRSTHRINQLATR